MEKISRMKKYENLRRSIETDNPVDHKEKPVLDSEHTLRQFDSALLKKIDIKEEEYQPEREKSIKEGKEIEKSDESGFTNEYLDDFIQEVRDYNIRKGTREYEDTQVDILNQLNAVNRAKRTQYVETIPNEKQDLTPDNSANKIALSKDDIALEVANLLKDETLLNDDVITAQAAEENEVTKETLEPLQTIKRDSINENQINSAIQEGIIEHNDEVNETNETEINYKEIIDPLAHKQILEETQQLRVQLDGYEDELTDLSDGMEKTNKLLNFILCFLILVLLVVIGFIVYSILKAGGKLS